MALIKLEKVRNTDDIESIKKAINYKNNKYKIAVASNINTPIEILFQLSKSGIIDVIRELASNTNIDDITALNIYNTNDFHSLESLSKNPSCPYDIIVKLSDYDIFFLNLVINPKATNEILVKILNARDSSDFFYEYIIDEIQKRTDIKKIEISYELILIE